MPWEVQSWTHLPIHFMSRFESWQLLMFESNKLQGCYRRLSPPRFFGLCKHHSSGSFCRDCCTRTFDFVMPGCSQHYLCLLFTSRIFFWRSPSWFILLYNIDRVLCIHHCSVHVASYLCSAIVIQTRVHFHSISAWKQSSFTSVRKPDPPRLHSFNRLVPTPIYYTHDDNTLLHPCRHLRRSAHTHFVRSCQHFFASSFQQSFGTSLPTLIFQHSCYAPPTMVRINHAKMAQKKILHIQCTLATSWSVASP